MLPFALVPEDVAVALDRSSSGLSGRRGRSAVLGLPLWWLAFPPFIDGLYNANPHVLVLPAAGGGGGAHRRALVKIYAGLVPLVLGHWRTVAISVAVLVVTIAVPALGGRTSPSGRR